MLSSDVLYRPPCAPADLTSTPRDPTGRGSGSNETQRRIGELLVSTTDYAFTPLVTLCIPPPSPSLLSPPSLPPFTVFSCQNTDRRRAFVSAAAWPDGLSVWAPVAGYRAVLLGIASTYLAEFELFVCSSPSRLARLVVVALNPRCVP